MKKMLIFAILLLCSSGVLFYLAYRAYTKHTFSYVVEGRIATCRAEDIIDHLEQYQGDPVIDEFLALARADARATKRNGTILAVAGGLCTIGAIIALVKSKPFAKANKQQ